MLSINEMLVSTIDKYLNDKRYAKVLTEVYNDFSLRKDFDFQSDKLTIYTILR
ncbi:hypothetical protein HOA93_05130 [bacterium]|jgi:hypothetical protein|nr:hypothetical protein [bacterium]